jgi:large subunit ribosomal protein L10
MAHVAPWKRTTVESIVRTLGEHPVVGVVSIAGIPAQALQKMRGGMRSDVRMVVSKGTLLNIALKEAALKGRPGLEQLGGSLSGPCALVLTDRNPFRLFKMMEGTKTRMAARGGEVAPEDISIRGGETSFKPGPIVRELQKVGIPAAIEKGKVIIKKDSVVCKRGEVISKDLAGILPKLDIMPLLIGLDLKAAYEDGIVYRPDVLDVDSDAIIAKMGQGATAAFGLSMRLGYTTKETIQPLLLMARGHGMALAVEAGIVTKETAGPIIMVSYAKAMSLAARVKPEALDEDILRRLQGAAVAAAPAAMAPAAKAEAKAEKKEEPKVSEDDAAAGLSSLFG